ncbi:MAG: ATP-binding protein, partial [Hymenobacter sp.]
EEPELGIHPHQLHLLLNFLREQSEKHQLIITTHSPQVLDMLREDELDRITICELHKTKGTQFRKLKKTQQDDARRYMREVGFLSDYWRLGDLEAAK